MGFKEIIKCIRKNWKKAKYRDYSEKEIFEYSTQLVKCAEIDYNTANILYKNKDKQYSSILYHIQQAIEKLVKAELILRKQLNRDQLKEINHRTPNAFLISLDSAMKDKIISPFLSNYINKDAIQEAKRYIFNPKEIMKSDRETLLKYDILPTLKCGVSMMALLVQDVVPYSFFLDKTYRSSKLSSAP